MKLTTHLSQRRKSLIKIESRKFIVGIILAHRSNIERVFMPLTLDEVNVAFGFDESDLATPDSIFNRMADNEMVAFFSGVFRLSGEFFIAAETPSGGMMITPTSAKTQGEARNIMNKINPMHNYPETFYIWPGGDFVLFGFIINKDILKCNDEITFTLCRAVKNAINH